MLIGIFFVYIVYLFDFNNHNIPFQSPVGISLDPVPWVCICIRGSPVPAHLYLPRSSILHAKSLHICFLCHIQVWQNRGPLGILKSHLRININFCVFFWLIFFGLNSILLTHLKILYFTHRPYYLGFSYLKHFYIETFILTEAH